MIRAILSLALLFLAFDTSAATIYTLLGGVPAPRSSDFLPPCEAGRCVNYRSDNVVTGWFTTREPLPANLDRVDIHARLDAYSFSDGVSVHASTNPDTRVQSFVVSTSSRGEVSVQRLWLVTWTSGMRPHRAGDRLNSLTLAGGFVVAQNNDFCIGVSSASGLGVETGVDDACPLVKPDRSSSVASTDACMQGGLSTCSPAAAAWGQQMLRVEPPLPVPALSGWGVGFLALIMTIAGGRFAVRRTQPR